MYVTVPWIELGLVELVSTFTCRLRIGMWACFLMLCGVIGSPCVIQVLRVVFRVATRRQRIASLNPYAGFDRKRCRFDYMKHAEKVLPRVSANLLFVCCSPLVYYPGIHSVNICLLLIKV